MQHPFFAPLQEQETALLLVALTVGGSDQLEIFTHLPADVAARLTDKARALAQISADKRVPLMVRELKSLLESKGRRGLERLDPSWIVQRLKGESPRVVAALLVGMPAPLVRSVLRRLPSAVRAELPPRQQLKRIDPEVADGVRSLFEWRFAAMPSRGQGSFAFVDIIHLERPEIFVLVRDLGLIELGQAFVSVGKMALLELCRRLPRAHAEELVHAVKVASRVDLPDAKSAQRFLSRVVVNFENTEELLQKAGLWRLAKACLHEPPSFRPIIFQRLPRRAAHYLKGYLDKAQEMEEVSEDVRVRLQDSILVRLVLLSRAGLLGPSWQEVPMQFHDSQAAEQALRPGGAGAAEAEAEADPMLSPVGMPDEDSAFTMGDEDLGPPTAEGDHEPT